MRRENEKHAVLARPRVLALVVQRLAVAARANSPPYSMDAPFYGESGSIHYEFQWDFHGQQPKANANGISGWARVINRSGGSEGLVTGSLQRVHRCAWKPCKAIYPANKYGLLGPPLHVQPSEWRPHDEPAAATATVDAVAAPGPCVPAQASEAPELAPPVPPPVPPPEPAAAPPPAAPAETLHPAVPAEAPPPAAPPPPQPMGRRQGHPTCLKNLLGNHSL